MLAFSDGSFFILFYQEIFIKFSFESFSQRKKGVGVGWGQLSLYHK